MRISLFIPCYIDQFYPGVGLSVVRVLERLGHKVEFDDELVCCGQPAFNAGYWPEAKSIAVKVLHRLAGAEAVVVPSGSCATMLRVFYRELFAGDPQEAAARELGSKTFEFSEFLVDKLGVTDLGSRFRGTATFHDGCHGLRELGVQSQPRRLLENVRELTLVEMEDVTTCCGFGGLFAVKFPMISTAMGETKCSLASNTGADYLISNDSSCLMHLEGLLKRSGSKLRTLHLAEVLANFR
ncbi:MAG: (Fe-S)-binding protein [Verrucomicrobia bacterium]|nr:(Fe-S)-binding protein [Verrucomicrobiota bacterium]MBV9274883.1 (Fe-S)-binding protein [Verrucomicrobiota bacterium]